MNQLEVLIFNALNTVNDNIKRSEAEACIFSLLVSNPSEFFYFAAEIVANSSNAQILRQSTCSVIKTLLIRRDEKACFYWDRVTIDVKNKVKDMLLSTLIEADAVIMRSGANAIAAIASIQVPRDEWLEIINNLAENTMNQDYNIRKASITTLGFVCQQLKAVNAKVNNHICSQILGSIIIGSRQKTSEELVEISLISLRDSIAFLKPLIENAEYRVEVINVLLESLDIEAHMKQSYEALFQFGKHCYNFVGDYLNDFILITQKHIQKRDNFSILALQFWDTLGTEYLQERSNLRDRIDNNPLQLNNYIQISHSIILPQVMNALLIYNNNDLGFAELREAAVKALATFVECGNQQIFDNITAGISRIIQSSNPGERQASALLFSCLCQYQDKNYTHQCFQNGFLHLLNLLNDPEHIVRKNTLNGFVTLSETFPTVFLRQPQIIEIARLLIIMSTENDEDIRILSLTILCNITEDLKSEPLLSNNPEQFLMVLFQNFKKYLSITTDDSRQTTQKIIIILMNTIMATNSREVSLKILSQLIDLYVIYNGANIKNKQIILESILSVLHTSTLVASKYLVPEPIKNKLYSLLDNYLKNYGIDQESISLIPALSYCFKKGFNEKLEHYWNFVMQGLEMADQKPLFKSVLTCIADLARNHETQLIHKITGVFSKLIHYMHENIDREIKTQILRTFGDMILSLKRYGQNFVDKLIDISNSCFEAVLKLSQIQNQKAYAEELKEVLIEMYHGMTFALNQNRRSNQKLRNHFQIMTSFVVKSCDVKYRPTVDYIKTCLYLVFDSALFYSANIQHKQSMDRVINSNEIQSLIRSILPFRDRQDIRTLLNLLEKRMKNKNYF